MTELKAGKACRLVAPGAILTLGFILAMTDELLALFIAAMHPDFTLALFFANLQT